VVPFLDDLARQAGRARDPEVEVDVEVREPSSAKLGESGASTERRSPDTAIT